MAIAQAKGISLKRLSNKVTGIVCRDSMFVDVMEDILTFAIELEREYRGSLFQPVFSTS